MSNKRKNVLFLASWFPNQDHETIGNFVQRHAEAIALNSNIQVLFATSRENQETDFEIISSTENEVKITRVYYKKIQTKIPGLASFLKLRKYKKALRLGYDSLNNNFDLCHVNVAFPSGLFAKELKQKEDLPYVVTAHWTGFLSFKNDFQVLPFYIKHLYKSIFSKASLVLPVSNHLGEALVKNKLIQEYTVVPNVINTNDFYPDFSVENEVKKFIHISTIDEEHKNFSGILKAFSSLDLNFELTIITDGDLKIAKQKVEAFGLTRKVTLHGTLKSNEVAAELRKSDCLVQFSNYETFSVVIAEAWMCGIPCIYSKCGGLTELKNQTLGVQIKPKNTEEFSQVLRTFIKNSSAFNKAQISNFAKLNFSNEHISLQVNKLYNSKL